MGVWRGWEAIWVGGSTDGVLLTSFSFCPQPWERMLSTVVFRDRSLVRPPSVHRFRLPPAISNMLVLPSRSDTGESNVVGVRISSNSVDTTHVVTRLGPSYLLTFGGLSTDLASLYNTRRRRPVVISLSYIPIWAARFFK